MKETPSQNVTLLRREEVSRRTGLSRSVLYARMKLGQFPRPVYLTPSTPAWLDSEVTAWIASLVWKRDAQSELTSCC